MAAQHSNPRVLRSPWRDPWVWGVLALALALRGFYLRDLTQTPFFFHPQMDAWFHDQWARRLAAGEGAGTEVFFRAPLYPYFLSVWYRLGLDATAVRVVQFLIGGGTVLATILAVYSTLGRRVALGAGFLVAVHGPLIYFEGELLLVVLETPLYLGTTWAVHRALGNSTPGGWALAGFLTGVGSLVRPILLAVVPVVALLLLWRQRQRAWLPGCIYAGALLVTLSPALVHNAVVGKDVVPVASQGGLNYFLGNNPAADGMAAIAPEFRQTWEEGIQDARHLAELRSGRALKPSEVSDYWYRQAFSWARNDPGAFLRHQVRKLAYFWDAYEIPNNQDYYYFSGLARIFHTPLQHAFAWLGPLALAGLVLSLQRRFLPAVWVIVPFTLMMVVVAFFVCAKFRVSLVPLLAVWASAGVGGLGEAWRERRRGQVLMYGVVLLIAAGIVNGDLWGHRAHHSFAESHLRLGVFYVDQGDSARAREHYEAAVTVRPDFAEGWNSLGTFHAENGDLVTARTAFETAVSIQPRHPRALGNLAALAFQEGRRADADSLARLTLKVAGRAPVALYNAAVILGNLGDIPTALLAFNALVTLQPWNAPARVGEVKSLIALGRYEQARRVLLAHPGPQSPELESLGQDIQDR